MAQSWWDPFSWGQKDPSFMTQKVTDPAKTAVSSPMSSYLASQVGKGLPRYTEGPLTEEFDKQGYSRYQEFLSMPAEEWFKSNVTDPTMDAWKTDVEPLISEGHAGSLRGSGRFRDVEASASDLTKDLATTGGQMIPQITQQQFNMASQFKAMKDRDYQVQYQEWYKSLPQMNPALGQAMQFLQKSTGTGTETLAALDPGQEGWFKDVLVAALIGFGGGSLSLGGDSMGGRVGLDTSQYYPAG